MVVQRDSLRNSIVKFGVDNRGSEGNGCFL